MLCENYKDALIEAAANGSEPQGELRTHLAACASCRETFAQEQSLFSTIDAGLRATANTEVPPSLLPRVRATLAEAAPAKTSWTTSWIAVAGAAALIAIAFTVYTFQRSNVETTPVVSAVHSPQNQVPPLEPPAKRDGVLQPQLEDGKNPKAFAAFAAHHSMPDVLVLNDQEVLLANYAEQLRRSKRTPLLAEDSNGTPLAPLEVAPIQIAQLDVKLLAEENSQMISANANE